MLWNTLLIVALLVGLATGGYVLLRRWQQRLLQQLDQDAERLSRELQETTDSLQQQLDAIQQTVVQSTETLTKRTGTQATALEKVVRRQASAVVDSTRKSVAKDIAMTFRQLEALQNLYAIGRVEHPIPPSRNWAGSPDLLIMLVELVESTRPRLIVECGSGLSTLWFALALRRFGINGQVVALEHSDEFAAKTRALVESHEVASLVDVRHAPLEPFEIADATYLWYGEKAWGELRDISLLLVDGPPNDTGPHARFPALPLLASRLRPDATVVLDDMIRTEEKETLEQWLQDYPEFTADHVRLEKNAALIHRKPA